MQRLSQQLDISVSIPRGSVRSPNPAELDEPVKSINGEISSETTTSSFLHNGYLDTTALLFFLSFSPLNEKCQAACYFSNNRIVVKLSS
jgi:hypothetical protein